jgi:medium-chain acyl-[acyl-carrier-protein] hydrolase
MIDLKNPGPAAWLPFAPNPQGRLRLFCFPYAGGGAAVFRSWSEYLPKEVEVCPIQLPGRGSRLSEAPFTSMQPLAEALTDVLCSKADIPFAFFGYSMGATLGFEMARQARKRRLRQPLHLFVAARRAPQIPAVGTPTHMLSDADFLVELNRLNGTPKEVLDNPELMTMMVPILRADFRVVQTYRYKPEPPLDCSISAYGGLEDHKITREQLQAWREQTTASFSLRMFPSDHFFLHTSQALLLRILSRELHGILETLT